MEGRPLSALLRLSNIRALYSVLRSTAFRERALIRISPAGLEVLVNDSTSVLAHAFCSADLCDEFAILGGDDGENAEVPPVLSFGVNLSTALDCLNIFGEATGLEKHHSGSGSTQVSVGNRTGGQAVTSSHTRLSLSFDQAATELIINLEDANVTTTCKLTTSEVDDDDSSSSLESTFNDDVLSKVVIKSEWLKEAIQELDSTSDKVTILVSPQAPYFQLSAHSMSGTAEVDYPKGTDIMETFSCSQQHSFQFKFSHLLPALKALGLSTKVQIKTYSRGFLSIQHLIPISENKHSFVSFTLAPEEE